MTRWCTLASIETRIMRSLFYVGGNIVVAWSRRVLDLLGAVFDVRAQVRIVEAG